MLKTTLWENNMNALPVPKNPDDASNLILFFTANIRDPYFRVSIALYLSSTSLSKQVNRAGRYYTVTAQLMMMMINDDDDE